MKIELAAIVAAIVALREVAKAPLDKKAWEYASPCLAAAHELELALCTERVEIVAAPAEKVAA